MDVNTIVCMDAFDYLKMLPDNSVDLTVTSPPYDNLRAYKGYSWDFEGIAHQLYRVLKVGGVVVWVVGDSTVDGSETLTSFKQVIYFKEQVGFRVHDTMIWEKISGTPGLHKKRCTPSFEFMFVISKGEPLTFNPPLEKTISGRKRKLKAGASSRGGWKHDSTERHDVKPLKVMLNVWQFDVGFGRTSTDGTNEHPAMMPEALAKRHILTWSNPGDIVLDCFMGSGTTAKMARANNRQFIGCDLSQEYVEIANKRLALPYNVLLPGME